MKARNLVLEMSNGLFSMGNPIKYLNEKASLKVKGSPELGEHTKAILKELGGYDEKVIDGFSKKGII